MCVVRVCVCMFVQVLVDRSQLVTTVIVHFNFLTVGFLKEPGTQPILAILASQFAFRIMFLPLVR